MAQQPDQGGEGQPGQGDFANRPVDPRQGRMRAARLAPSQGHPSQEDGQSGSGQGAQPDGALGRAQTSRVQQQTQADQREGRRHEVTVETVLAAANRLEGQDQQQRRRDQQDIKHDR